MGKFQRTALIRSGLPDTAEIRQRASGAGQSVQGLLASLEEVGPYGAELAARAMEEAVEAAPGKVRKRKGVG